MITIPKFNLNQYQYYPETINNYHNIKSERIIALENDPNLSKEKISELYYLRDQIIYKTYEPDKIIECAIHKLINTKFAFPKTCSKNRDLSDQPFNSLKEFYDYLTEDELNILGY